MASINDLATAATAASALTQPTPGMSTTAPTAQGAPTAAPTVARGALVVLEGLDRSGKTTQVKLLEQRFVELGRKVKLMRFPGRLFAVVARSIWPPEDPLGLRNKTDGIEHSRQQHYVADYPVSQIGQPQSVR